jgi:hypothetical protein
MEEIDWSGDILAVLVLPCLWNRLGDVQINIGRCICRYVQSIVSGMNDSNTLK